MADTARGRVTRRLAVAVGAAVAGLFVVAGAVGLVTGTLTSPVATPAVVALVVALGGLALAGVYGARAG